MFTSKLFHLWLETTTIYGLVPMMLAVPHALLAEETCKFPMPQNLDLLLTKVKCTADAFVDYHTSRHVIMGCLQGVGYVSNDAALHEVPDHQWRTR